MQDIYDVVIIGGGINGCGIAAEAAQRGLSVLLLEKDDLASKTSSKSSNLIHGGLRYLENFEFSLVKKALDERQILLNIAPHLVQPARFILPHVKKMRAAWLIRMGLFIYDHLSWKNTLAKSKTIHRKSSPHYFSSLRSIIKKGFAYSDAITQDSRLCIENALQAREYGASILPKSPFISARHQSSYWEVYYEHKNQTQYCQARCLINAAGPWANQIIQQLNKNSVQPLALVKGSHIVVPKLYDESHAYMLQHPDKRIIFVAPYHGFTMIGTTDVRLSKIPDSIEISTDEINYLLETCNRYFTKQLTPNDIMHSWSGVRPLIEDSQSKAQKLSREYRISFENTPGPLLNIYGGKITTYRQLSVEAINRLTSIFTHMSQSSSHVLPLPGSKNITSSWHDFCAQQYRQYDWIDKNILQNLLSRYGTRCIHLLEGAHSLQDLGQHFGHGLFQKEVDWLVNEEWAQSAEDILWRRSKLGLSFNADEQQVLQNYLRTK